jgi:hypothetical protein
MKTTSTILLCGLAFWTAIHLHAYTVYTPPGNIVQNGDFHSYFANWSGNMPAILGNWASIPNNYAGVGNDIYQDLQTSPGQAYSLSFYAAADLYLSPTVSISVALNQIPSFSFDTPPYAYNPQVNRYDQMRWQQVTYTFTASSTTTRLEFVERSTYDFGLAAVSVVAVPEPASLTLILLGFTAIGLIRRKGA